jgi:hypothetical protein
MARQKVGESRRMKKKGMKRKKGRKNCRIEVRRKKWEREEGFRILGIRCMRPPPPPQGGETAREKVGEWAEMEDRMNQGVTRRCRLS